MNTLKQSIIGVTILASLYGCGGGGGTDTSAAGSDSTTGVKTASPTTITTTDQTSTQTASTTTQSSTTNNSAKSASVSNNTSTLHTKLGYNYHDYYNYTGVNTNLNMAAAKSMLAAGVKWARVFRDAGWGTNQAEDNALLAFMQTFRQGGGKILFVIGWGFDNYGNLANDANQRNEVADQIMNGPRGVKYTLAKYAGQIDAMEMGNEYQLHGSWDPNNPNSPNSGIAYARLMNIVVPQVAAAAPTLPIYPSSTVENSAVSLTQGAQFMVDLYNNSSNTVKAKWAGPNLHIYDHLNKSASGIIGKFNTLSAIIDKVWPNAQYVITEVGITTGTAGEYSGATVYNNDMQRDIMVDIAKSWASNSKINFWNFYEWNDKGTAYWDGENSFGTLTFDMKPKTVNSGKSLYDSWVSLP